MKTPLTPELRQAIIERDGYMCRHCFMGWSPLEIHHRKGRGGSDPNNTANLLTLCASCHKRVTENPEWAYKTGLSIRRLGKDIPDEVPFEDYLGDLWCLTGDGQLIHPSWGGAA